MVLIKNILMFEFLLIACFIHPEPMPKIFLIGDSISIHYSPYLEKFFENHAIFDRKKDDGQVEKNLDIPVGANGGDSRMVLKYLQAKLNNPDFNPDYLILNCGLHDIKRNPHNNKIHVDENEYKENLSKILQLLQKQNIQMIWIRTTPVVDSIHNKKSTSFYRYNSDVIRYNEIADEIFNMHKIPIIDLYNFTCQLGTEQYVDHVHFNETTRSLQAAYIAGFVSGLKKR